MAAYYKRLKEGGKQFNIILINNGQNLKVIPFSLYNSYAGHKYNITN